MYLGTLHYKLKGQRSPSVNIFETRSDRTTLCRRNSHPTFRVSPSTHLPEGLDGRPSGELEVHLAPGSSTSRTRSTNPSPRVESSPSETNLRRHLHRETFVEVISGVYKDNKSRVLVTTIITTTTTSPSGLKKEGQSLSSELDESRV